MMRTVGAKMAAHLKLSLYRNLFNSMDQGYCIIEMIFDAHDKPVDYLYLQVNPSFEAMSGMHAAQGTRIRELVPDLEEYWLETYGKVALTGEAVRVANEVKPLQRRGCCRTFSIYSRRPTAGWTARRAAWVSACAWCNVW